MAALVLDGVTVPVAMGGAARLADEAIGDSSRSILGANQNSIRGRKRGWQVTTTPLSQADSETLRVTLAGDAFTASGDLLGGSVSVVGELGEAALVPCVLDGVWSPEAEALTFILREE